MTFRRVLDEEMKEATRMGVTLKTKEDEKEAVNNDVKQWAKISVLFTSSLNLKHWGFTRFRWG